MYDRILVPLDGSEFGEHALPAAIGIGVRAGSELRLIHVLDPDGDVAAAQVPETAEGERADHAAARYISDLAGRVSRATDLAASTTILEGPVVPTLLGYVEQTHVDLIVMTTHGRGGLARAWLGSVADGVVREAGIPILLVRPGEDGEDGEDGADPVREESFKHLVIPLDGSTLAERVIEPALDLVRLMEARVTLIRVVPVSTVMAYRYAAYAVELDRSTLERVHADAEQYLAGAAGRLAERGVQAETRVVTDETPARAILAAIDETGADLVAMSTRGRSGISRRILGSVADKVVRGADVPVLVCRVRD